MRHKMLALAAASLLLSGCYRVTVVHNPGGVAQASAPAQINKAWQPSFIYGLVPPPEVNTKEQCPNGVAKVETVHSFLNGLVAGILYSLYTPITVKVTCAAR